MAEIDPEEIPSKQRKLDENSQNQSVISKFKLTLNTGKFDETSSELVYSQTVVHSGFQWFISMRRNTGFLMYFLDSLTLHCERIPQKPLKQWNVQVEAKSEYFIGDTEKLTFRRQKTAQKIKTRHHYSNESQFDFECEILVQGVLETPHFDFSVENEQLFTDQWLVVGGKEFHVCRITLASFSTYFSNQFFKDFQDSNHKKIHVGMISANDFQELLEFIYQLNEMTDYNIVALLETSSYLDMENIKAKCEKFLINCTRKAQEKVYLADKHALLELMDHTVKQLKTVEDVQDCLPENVEDLNPSTATKLLQKIRDFRKPKIQAQKPQDPPQRNAIQEEDYEDAEF